MCIKNWGVLNDGILVFECTLAILRVLVFGVLNYGMLAVGLVFSWTYFGHICGWMRLRWDVLMTIGY